MHRRKGKGEKGRASKRGKKKRCQRNDRKEACELIYRGVAWSLRGLGPALVLLTPRHYYSGCGESWFVLIQAAHSRYSVIGPLQALKRELTVSVKKEPRHLTTR